MIEFTTERCDLIVFNHDYHYVWFTKNAFLYLRGYSMTKWTKFYIILNTYYLVVEWFLTQSTSPYMITVFP